MGEHSISPKTAGFMDILHHATAKSRHSSTARAGLMVPATLLEWLGLGETVDKRMPGPGSNRGYRHGTIFETCMPTSHEGAECPEDVRQRHGEHALTGLPGLRRVPRRRATGCAGSAGTGRPGTCCRKSAAGCRSGPAGAGPRDPGHRCPGGACEEEDRKAHRPGPAGRHADGGPHRRDRLGGEVRAAPGQRAARREEPGVPRHCIGTLPEGAGVSRFRADAASYPAGMVSACREHGARLAIRARMDGTEKCPATAFRHGSRHR